MALKKLVGKKSKRRGNPSGVTSVKVGDKVVNTFEPVELTEREVELLEEKGYVLTNGSKQEKDAIDRLRQQSPVIGGDVVAAAPVFGYQYKQTKST